MAFSFEFCGQIVGPGEVDHQLRISPADAELTVSFVQLARAFGLLVAITLGWPQGTPASSMARFSRSAVTPGHLDLDASGASPGGREKSIAVLADALGPARRPYSSRLGAQCLGVQQTFLEIEVIAAHSGG
ncbi:hypothetical protein [Novosphingobium sp.]|uniref:hypothetical protein n=1 Tax=Novosphingobium sp. TaxID=1874826 RepID=UPI0035B40AEA